MTGLVEVYRGYGPEEMYCARSYLASHGIWSWLRNEHHLTAAPHYRVALGGYDLLVAAEDAEDALAAFEDAPSHAIADEDYELPERGPKWFRYLWVPIAVIMVIEFSHYRMGPVRRWAWAGAFVLLAPTAPLTFYYIAYDIVLEILYIIGL